MHDIKCHMYICTERGTKKAYQSLHVQYKLFIGYPFVPEETYPSSDPTLKQHLNNTKYTLHKSTQNQYLPSNPINVFHCISRAHLDLQHGSASAHHGRPRLCGHRRRRRYVWELALITHFIQWSLLVRDMEKRRYLFIFKVNFYLDSLCCY